jgi:hypothetical protein
MAPTLLAACLVALITLPHLLPLQRVAPTTAAAVWLLALSLRALAAVAAATYMLVYLPDTPRFMAADAWCVHFVVPLLSIHIHLPGLRIAHGLVVIPTLVLAASLAAASWRRLRARFYAQRLVRRLGVGDGPLGSTLVATEEVLLAVTQVGPPRLLVSGRTLATLDQDELNAGLQHELGHLRRPHRQVLFAASVLRALARWQPGVGAAHRELCFSLERDADEYALRQTRNPMALASAICKAALAQGGNVPLMGLRGQSRVSLRLDYLLAGGTQRAGVKVERAFQVLAFSMLVLMLFVAVAAPAWALATPGSLPHLFPGSSGWNC